MGWKGSWLKLGRQEIVGGGGGSNSVVGVAVQGDLG